MKKHHKLILTIFFGIKKTTLNEIGLYQQRVEMYKNKNIELENELHQIQSKYNDQIREFRFLLIFKQVIVPSQVIAIVLTLVPLFYFET